VEETSCSFSFSAGFNASKILNLGLAIGSAVFLILGTSSFGKSSETFILGAEGSG